MKTTTTLTFALVAIALVTLTSCEKESPVNYGELSSDVRSQRKSESSTFQSQRISENRSQFTIVSSSEIYERIGSPDLSEAVVVTMKERPEIHQVSIPVSDNDFLVIATNDTACLSSEPFLVEYKSINGRSVFETGFADFEGNIIVKNNNGDILLQATSDGNGLYTLPFNTTEGCVNYLLSLWEIRLLMIIDAPATAASVLTTCLIWDALGYY